MYSKIIFLIVFVFTFLPITNAQIGTTIPIERRVDWDRVGYDRNPESEFPASNHLLELPPPAINPEENYKNIIDKLNEACKIDGIVEIRFKTGVYELNKPILLTPANNNLIFRGEGSQKVTLKFISPSKNNGVYGIRIEGIPLKSEQKNRIVNYNRNEKKIVLSNKLTDVNEHNYFDIRVENGSWFNSSNTKNDEPRDFLGQIVKIKSAFANGSEFIIEDDISIVWEKAVIENKTIYAEIFKPAENIGFIDFKVECDNNNNGLGSNFIFRYAANCFVENIESYNPPQVHFDIDRSASIVLRECNIHHAQDYGKIPGAGYGIHVHTRSTNCLIENNIFYHLRHSIIITRSASRNVFGYNFSTDQYSFPVKNLSDLNIHGFYPFLNLFEGNVVERIQGDSYWGSNGPYNTFFRNYITSGYYKLEEANYSNSILNSSNPQLSKSEFVLINQSKSLNDISYYYKQKPNFLKSINWPPIDNNSNENYGKNTSLIPAQTRYLSE